MIRLIECETLTDLDRLYKERGLWTTEARIRYLKQATKLRYTTAQYDNPLDELKDLEDLALAKLWMTFQS